MESKNCTPGIKKSKSQKKKKRSSQRVTQILEVRPGIWFYPTYYAYKLSLPVWWLPEEDTRLLGQRQRTLLLSAASSTIHIGSLALRVPWGWTAQTVTCTCIGCVTREHWAWGTSKESALWAQGRHYPSLRLFATDTTQRDGLRKEGLAMPRAHGRWSLLTCVG